MRKATAWVRIKIVYTFNEKRIDEVDAAYDEAHELGAKEVDIDSIEIVGVESTDAEIEVGHDR